MSEEAAAAIPEEELYCPSCEYSLRGLVEERCPECGEAFDREAIRKACDGLRVAPWCERAEIRRREAWVLTCREILLRPAAFARRFPPVPRSADVQSFAGVSRVVAFLLSLVCGALGCVVGYAQGGGPFPIVIAVFGSICVFVPWLVASFICEVVLGSLLSRVEDGKEDRLSVDRGWPGLMNFGCVFLVLLAPGAGLAAYVLTVWNGILDGVPVIYCGGVILWWWLWVGRVLSVRSGGGRHWLLLVLSSVAAMLYGVLVAGPVCAITVVVLMAAAAMAGLFP